MNNKNINDGSWHLDKRVNLSLIGGLLLQAIVFGYLYGNVESRVVSLEKASDTFQELPERLARQETLLEQIREELRALRVAEFYDNRRPVGTKKKKTTDQEG